MRFLNRQPAERRGFTVIELLVVIAIIGILVALAASAIMPLIGKGPVVQNVNDIRQLAVALETFKSEFKTYPPSHIFLSNDPSVYTSSGAPPLLQESYSYLTHIWPNLYRPHVDPATGTTTVTPVDWGNAQGLLQGDQCLVFFLGGLQTASGPVGFSTNSYNPMLPPAMTGETRKGPYFNFDSTRLFVPSDRKPPFNSTAFVYLDVYLTKPYAFFSSPKGANRYNAAPLGTGLPAGDCPSLGVSPFVKNATVPLLFYNPDTFQIVSAGADKTFGPGGVVPPGSAVQGVGADDYSNITGAQHGAGF